MIRETLLRLARDLRDDVRFRLHEKCELKMAALELGRDRLIDQLLSSHRDNEHLRGEVAKRSLYVSLTDARKMVQPVEAERDALKGQLKAYAQEALNVMVLYPAGSKESRSLSGLVSVALSKPEEVPAVRASIAKGNG